MRIKPSYFISRSPFVNNQMIRVCFRWVVTFLFLFTFLISNAQVKNIDSLKEKLGVTKGTERVDLLNLLASELIFSNQKQALKFANEADSIANILSYTSGRSLAYRNLGKINKEAGNYSKSLQFLKGGLKLSKEIDDISSLNSILFETGIVNYRMGDYEVALDNFNTALEYYQSVSDKAWIANVKNELGNVNLFQSNYSKALEYYFEALKIREEYNDFEKSAQTLNNIGLVYMYQQSFDQALNYLKQSLKLKTKYGDNKTIANSYNNVGLVYELKKDLKEALNSYFKALEYLKPETDKSTITTVESNIGLVYGGMGDYDKALFYLKKSLKAKEQMGEKADIAQGLTSIGKTYRQKTDYQQAISYGIMGLNKAFEIKSKKEIQEAAENLYLTYEQIKDYKNALKYHIISENYKDSLRNEIQAKEIGRLEAKYAYDKQKIEEEKIRFEKEQDEKIEEARERIIIFSAFALLGILFIAAIFYVKSVGRKNKVITEQNEEQEAILNTLQIAHTKLVQSEKMASLGVLTAGVAHEINNPVNFVFNGIENIKVNYHDLIRVVSKYEEILKKRADKKDYSEIEIVKKEFYYDEVLEEIPQTIDIVKNGATRISEIVKGLRNFSRLDESTKKEVDLHEGIDSSIVLLKNKMKYKIDLIKDYDENSRPVNCYPGQLNQVFLNILDNAIGAIDEKGTITISTEFSNDKVYISFKDTGKGISDKIKKKVFDPFFTTKDVGRGVGLGLSISHGIIEKHGGKITFDSEENKGATFRIELPMQ